MHAKHKPKRKGEALHRKRKTLQKATAGKPLIRDKGKRDASAKLSMT